VRLWLRVERPEPEIIGYVKQKVWDTARVMTIPAHLGHHGVDKLVEFIVYFFDLVKSKPLEAGVARERYAAFTTIRTWVRDLDKRVRNLRESLERNEYDPEPLVQLRQAIVKHQDLIPVSINSWDNTLF
jgi:hypothetical protein